MNMRFKLLIMLGLLSVVAAPLQADQVPSKADKVRDAQRHDKTPQGYLGPSVIKPNKRNRARALYRELTPICVPCLKNQPLSVSVIN